MRRIIIFSLLLTAGTAFSESCPNFSQVYQNQQWKTPAGWQKLPLSPLADTTGKREITAVGLIQIYYLEKPQTLRCIYSKKGMGVSDNTYIIKKQVNPFYHDKGPWTEAMPGVWSCTQAKSDARVAMKVGVCGWSEVATVSPSPIKTLGE